MASYVVPLIALLLVAAVFVAALHIVLKDKKGTIAAYDRMLARRDDEYEILADRMFLKERVPPSGVNLTEAHQERVEEERIHRAERRLRGQEHVATGVGPVDRAQNDMIRDYRRKHPSSTATTTPASTTLEETIQNRQNTGAVA